MSYWFHVGDNFDANCTSNVACMWREAGCDLKELKDKKAADCIKPLCDAINRMLSDPDKYKAMNPSNGWGSYEGCIDFLKACHDACMSDPDSLVHVGY